MFFFPFLFTLPLSSIEEAFFFLFMFYLVKHYVFRLNITVNESSLMDISESHEHLSNYLLNRPKIHIGIFIHLFFQWALHFFHQNVIEVLFILGFSTVNIIQGLNFLRSVDFNGISTFSSFTLDLELVLELDIWPYRMLTFNHLSIIFIFCFFFFYTMNIAITSFLDKFDKINFWVCKDVLISVYLDWLGEGILNYFTFPNFTDQLSKRQWIHIISNEWFRRSLVFLVCFGESNFSDWLFKCC